MSLRKHIQRVEAQTRQDQEPPARRPLSARAAFCGPGERIAGFIFIGRAGRALEERPRPDLADVWKPWQPPNL